MPIRIKGLISAFNDVRAQLQAGISPDEEERFRDHVRALLARVEEICVANGTTPNALPSPSRRAYTFLKNLDTRNLPKPDALRAATAHPRMKIANVVKNVDTFSKRMWDDLPELLESSGTTDRLASEMLELVTRIEAICSQRDTTPASLETPSRRAYGWLKFLLDGDNLRLHLAALDRGRSALVETDSRPEHVEMHMLNMNSIWRRRSRGNLVQLNVNEGFLHADDKVWQVLLKVTLKKGGGKVRGTVDEFIDSEEFSGVLFEIEAFTEKIVPSSGHVHNLDQSFERVNAAYFGGHIPKPRLRWNHVLTARKFGHYESARDTVMLSVSLDDPSVPQLLVDYVMYHELLHKRHGVKLVNGRRMAHTATFRKADQNFKGYEDAINQLNALARRHSSR